MTRAAITPIAVATALSLLIVGAPASAQPAAEPAARLRVTTTVPDALVSVDGEPAILQQGVLAVSPGQHTLTAEVEDGRYWAQVVDVTAGQDLAVTLGPTLAQAPPPPPVDLRVRPSAPEPTRYVDRYPRRRLGRAWAWLGVGTSTAFAAGLVAAALHTMTLSDTYRQQPSRDLRDEGLMLRGLTQYVLLPATIASVGLTVVAFVLSTPTVTEP